jgi:hypothetical protein
MIRTADGWPVRPGRGILISNNPAEGPGMEARAPWVITWLVLGVIGAGCLTIAGFWLWAIMTGGKYM